MPKISSWGLLKAEEQDLYTVRNRRYNFYSDLLKTNKKLLPRGNGRSYGDVCQNENGVLLSSLFLDNYIKFIPERGLITVESGVILKDLQRFLVRHGFMLPVTPGTEMITVGGAIANDVHCKNHHMFGTFGNHVESLTLLRSDGEVLNCSLSENEGYFRATIGGLGLTGFITDATLKLKKVDGPWIDAENIPYSNLKEFFEIAKESEKMYEHTVSWIDCISGNGERGIFMRGNNSKKKKLTEQNFSLGVPFMMPFSLVNQFSLWWFNHLYYLSQRLKKKHFTVHYEKFFYPLDNIQNWNRIYGPQGFYQYQFVVPMNNGFDAVTEVQHEIAKSGQGSFLGVLKTFGSYKSLGLLSFPFEGFTYALDFPNKGAETLKLFQNLDSIVEEAGGRLYLAKDARQPKRLFLRGYGKAMDTFIKYVDPKLSSDLSRRLMGF